MKYKLIAMDLDGTLNNDEKHITEKTLAALMAAQQRGNQAGNGRGHHIAQHNGEHIGGPGAGIAGAEHTEDQTEGHAVEAGAEKWTFHLRRVPFKDHIG